MAYLDTTGNVDQVQGPIVAQWVAFHATQSAVPSIRASLVAPVSAVPAGAEKTIKRT